MKKIIIVSVPTKKVRYDMPFKTPLKHLKTKNLIKGEEL